MGHRYLDPARENQHVFRSRRSVDRVDRAGSVAYA
jgi:hypothetical protein